MGNNSVPFVKQKSKESSPFVKKAPLQKAKK